MSIIARILHRFQSGKPDNPADAISVNVWNDSHPISTTAGDGSVLVCDSAHPDGLGASGLLRGIHDLGGSTVIGIQSASYVSAPEWRHPYIDSTGWSNAVARIERRTSNTATSVQIQIVDIDDDFAVVGTGVIYNTDTNWNEELIVLTLNVLPHRYELQLQGSNILHDVFVQGRIELYP